MSKSEMSASEIAFRLLMLIVFVSTFLCCWIKSLESRVRDLETRFGDWK